MRILHGHPPPACPVQFFVTQTFMHDLFALTNFLVLLRFCIYYTKCSVTSKLNLDKETFRAENGSTRRRSAMSVRQSCSRAGASWNL